MLGNIEAVELLIEKRANLNVSPRLQGLGKIFNKGSPMYFASDRGHLAIVKMLIKKGADLNIIEEKKEKTALCVAIEKSHLKIAKELIVGGADVNLGNPLNLATLNGNNEIIDLLKSKGAFSEQER